MANKVQFRRNTHLPGAGFDAAGNPVQGKQRVVGRITVTTYSRGGETLKPSDVGLRTIDYIDIKATEAVSGNSGAPVTVHYSASGQEFYVLEGRDELGATKNPVLSFVAEGDSAATVDLL